MHISDSPTIEVQLRHRTIREFTGEAVPADVLNRLLEVANRTATSTGMQSYSVIRITDGDKRRQIAGICRQQYVARVPELLIFIADAYRNARIAAEQGCLLPAAGDMDRFFQGFTDAALAAQNVTVAAESLGMGAAFFGSILNDAEGMVEVLKLPPLTFPVVGLGLGYPAQDPQQKPRMDLSLKVFENEYRPLERYLPAIARYDETMRTYYDLRDGGKSADSFSRQVVARLEGALEKRGKILNAVRRQGFILGLEEG